MKAGQGRTLRLGYTESVPEYYIGCSMEFVRHPRARRYVIRVRPDGWKSVV